MRFSKSENYQLGQAELLEFLNQSLKKGPVLWLVSGGSNSQIEVAIVNQLDYSLTSNLKILLTDERYGPKGHEASNYQQLRSAGLNIKRANFPDILELNVSPKETLQHYINTYEELKDQSRLAIAQLGIGDDGHIAGVLPNSPVVNSKDVAVYYNSRPYKRLTLTLDTLKTIAKTYVFCFGENKQLALDRLKAGQETLEALPSGILSEMSDVTVYNDHLEG